MSKYFRPWNIDQTLLLPPNVRFPAISLHNARPTLIREHALTANKTIRSRRCQ